MAAKTLVPFTILEISRLHSDLKLSTEVIFELRKLSDNF